MSIYNRVIFICVLSVVTVSCAQIEAIQAQNKARYLEKLRQDCRQFGFKDDTPEFSKCLQERDQFSQQQASAKAQESQRQLENLTRENKENLQRTMDATQRASDSLMPKTTHCKPDMFGGLVCQ